jgi:hypothetical protein
VLAHPGGASRRIRPDVSHRRRRAGPRSGLTMRVAPGRLAVRRGVRTGERPAEFSRRWGI